MKSIPSKDLVFVGIQLLLFILYFVLRLNMLIHFHPVISYTGLILAIAGVIILILAIIQLNDNLTPWPSPKVNGTLIQQGLYQYIRHPIYTGILLIALGYGVYTDSLSKIAITTGLWILFYFKSRYEETLLIHQYSTYPAYKKKTGRFLPVWRSLYKAHTE